MKKIIGCFALIGLMILLAVGGCIALIGYGISSLPEIPKYANAEQIRTKYQQELNLIKDKIIENKISELDKQLPQEIYAIYKADEELLKRHEMNGHSHLIVNNAGVGILHISPKKVQCMAYELNCQKADYIIFIYDDQAVSNQPPPAKK